ncbi:unnamed protein product [Rotaria sordida]|uniref:PPIase FKBP-type domain-containing protein n=1 Tax=Rotaria sordida TaxID=392033 RepID=A0A818YIG7_9BILA|nr:unnamed protein product [Rotaria sordida]CAF3750536.1 unnamed protein product [Rotaria sordida]
MTKLNKASEQVLNELLNDDADLDEYGEWTDEALARATSKQPIDNGGEEEYGHVKLRKPIDMQTLCSSKGQILELDQNELDSAELARIATQMAMDNIKENQQTHTDQYINNELKSTIPSRDLFSQRLIDNTQDFDDQLGGMQHLIKTNGDDGIPLNGIPSSEAAGGIWKQIIYSGVGETPPLGSTVRIHYNAYFELNDEPYDSTYIRRRPCEFQLGKFNVLPGLDLAVRTMQRRERAKFIISSDLLYGEYGCPPRIPPKAWSLFVIELISWIDCTLIEKLNKLKTTNDDEITEDFDERIRIAQTLRDMGNDEYAKHNLERAIRYYAKGKQFLLKTKTTNENQTIQQKELLLKLYLNSAQCYLKLRNHERTIKNCNEALQLDPKNIKALFRISIAYRSLHQFDQAHTYLNTAINIEPYNAEIIDEAQRLDRAIEQQKKNEQKLYYRMFNK